MFKDEFIKEVTEALKVTRSLEIYEKYDLEKIYDKVYDLGYANGFDEGYETGIDAGKPTY